MLLICGTVPIKDFPLTLGEVGIDEGSLVISGMKVPCTQGTAALISATLAVTGYLKTTPPQALLVGDTGRGKGSRMLYDYLIKNIAAISPAVLVLHYCLPIMALMRTLVESVGKCPERPVMIADASSMYAVKAAGLAERFDIFTPDSCEMAFLADPFATHPAYIGRHLFDTDITQVPQLVADAYRNKSAARLLLIKGAVDYVVEKGKILDTITEPDIPVLEAIGGTGDTITGMVSAFVYAGLELHEAAIIAARANRMAGKYVQVTPATRVSQIISQLPAVFSDYLCEWSGVCYGAVPG